MMCNPRVLLFCGRGDPPFLPVYQGPYSNNTPLSHRPTIGHYRVKMFRYRYRFFPLIQCTFSRTINNIICNTIFTRTACLYLSVMFRSHVRQCNTISRLVQSINQRFLLSVDFVVSWMRLRSDGLIFYLALQYDTRH